MQSLAVKIFIDNNFSIFTTTIAYSELLFTPQTYVTHYTIVLHQLANGHTKNELIKETTKYKQQKKNQQLYWMKLPSPEMKRQCRI